MIFMTRRCCFLFCFVYFLFLHEYVSVRAQQSRYGLSEVYEGDGKKWRYLILLYNYTQWPWPERSTGFTVYCQQAPFSEHRAALWHWIHHGNCKHKICFCANLCRFMSPETKQLHTDRGTEFFFFVLQQNLWGSPFWMRFLHICDRFFSNYCGNHISSSWMVHAGCVFVAGIHLSRTWMSGSFESMRWNACVHRLHLGWCSHLKEFLGNGVRTPVNSKGKILCTGKILLRGGSNPWRYIKQDSEPNIQPTELFQPLGKEWKHDYFEPIFADLWAHTQNNYIFTEAHWNQKLLQVSTNTFTWPAMVWFQFALMLSFICCTATMLVLETVCTAVSGLLQICSCAF